MSFMLFVLFFANRVGGSKGFLFIILDFVIIFLNFGFL